jgi:hypothetical protein
VTTFLKAPGLYSHSPALAPVPNLALTGNYASHCRRGAWAAAFGDTSLWAGRFDDALSSLSYKLWTHIMNMTFNAPQPTNKDAIGRVVSAAGSKLVVLLVGDDVALGDVHMGSLVSVRGTHTTVYGLVSSLDTVAFDAKRAH